MKRVKMIIQVPNGDFCWDQRGDFEICGHLDMTGGRPHCSLGFNPRYHHMAAGPFDDIEKPPECRLLKEVQPHED